MFLGPEPRPFRALAWAHPGCIRSLPRRSFRAKRPIPQGHPGPSDRFPGPQVQSLGGRARAEPLLNCTLLPIRMQARPAQIQQTHGYSDSIPIICTALVPDHMAHITQDAAHARTCCPRPPRCSRRGVRDILVEVEPRDAADLRIRRRGSCAKSGRPRSERAAAGVFWTRPARARRRG